ncbi:centromere protein H [Myripristis murdjan]|uniref:Centromere protein H C-terminal domain-containing protein n=1 Tax=Myripristis murdjan TaxID=586833 RepID=A0A667XFX9_9TELE|nr:centromere protein H [Myripristis murdjan]
MDPSDDVGDPGHTLKTGELNNPQAHEGCSAQKDPSPTDLLRIKEQMSSQCFEMAVQLRAGKSKRTCSTTEAERELPDYVSELEEVKTIHFNKIMTLHRMQMWHAIAEKLKQNDSESVTMKAVSERCMALCSRAKHLQQESQDLEDQIIEIQKKRLELKRLIHEKMKEMDELKCKREHPDMEKYKAVIQKGQANLEKYRKMVIMTQNVLRGILLASKVNWLDDPKLRDIAMTLEELPISD